MEQFDSNLSSVIDSTLGMRCRLYGYQYSEIIRSLMSVYFCGGSCIEDVTTHLMYHLSLHPTLRTCSADTILRAIKELTMDNISYTSDTGKTYDFNTADKLNTLLLNCLLSIRQLNNICKKANILQLKFAIRACFSYNLFCNVKLNTHRLKLFISNILFQFWVQVYTFLWNRKNCGIPIFLISQLDSLIV